MTREHLHPKKPVRLPRCAYSVRTEDDLFGVFGPEMIEEPEVLHVVSEHRHVGPRNPRLEVTRAFDEAFTDEVKLPLRRVHIMYDFVSGFLPPKG